LRDSAREPAKDHCKSKTGNMEFLTLRGMNGHGERRVGVPRPTTSR
jgi:hypothetical protein